MFTDLIDPAPAGSSDQGAAARPHFLHLLRAAASAGSLTRLTLSKPRPARPDEDLAERVLIRPVVLRQQPHLQFVHRHATRDVTRNLPVEQAAAAIDQLLTDPYQQAHLWTVGHEVQLKIRHKGGRDKSHVHVTRRQTTAAPDPVQPQAHNREKQRWLELDNPVWEALGITHRQAGRTALVASMASKWKQINRFTEILAGALGDAGLDVHGALRVIDFGCGKGYLTAAVHAWLRGQGGTPHVVGVELREALVAQCEGMARGLGRDGLEFRAGDVRDYTPDPQDVVIALHACDTATDHAIALGLRAQARVILCSPCCHKELRPQMQAPSALRPLLQHGIHLGQEAEMVTDGLRAMLLEAEGYDTRIFEFVSLEHTNKNKMILAVRRPHGDDERRSRARDQVATLKGFYGIRRMCLEDLLEGPRD